MDLAKLHDVKGAVHRAVHGAGPSELAAALRSDWPLSPDERNLIADYVEGKIKRPAHRPRKRSSFDKFKRENPRVRDAVAFVEKYKLEQAAKGRVHGVQKEAIEKARLKFDLEYQTIFNRIRRSRQPRRK